MESTRYEHGQRQVKVGNPDPKHLEALLFPVTEDEASSSEDEGYPQHEVAGFKSIPACRREGKGPKGRGIDEAKADQGLQLHDEEDDPTVAELLFAAEFDNDNPGEDPDYEEIEFGQHVNSRTDASGNASYIPTEIIQGDRMVLPCAKCCRAMASMKGLGGREQNRWICFRTQGSKRCGECKQRGKDSCHVQYTSDEAVVVQRWVDKFTEFEKDPSNHLKRECLALGADVIDAIPSNSEFSRRLSAKIRSQRDREKKKGGGKTIKTTAGSSLWSPNKPDAASGMSKEPTAGRAVSPDSNDQAELLRRILNASEKQAASAQRQANAVDEIKRLLARVVETIGKR